MVYDIAFLTMIEECFEGKDEAAIKGKHIDESSELYTFFFEYDF